MTKVLAGLLSVAIVLSCVQPAGAADAKPELDRLFGDERTSVDQVEHERRMDVDARVQRRWRVPGAITHRADELADLAGRLQRHAPAVAGEDVAVADEAGHVHLDPLDR